MKRFAWAAVVLALIGCSGPAPEEAQPRAVLVRTLATTPAGVNRDVDVYAGEVRARFEHDLSFRIGGKVLERKVDVGAHVKKGDVLARLDPQDVTLAANAARARVSAAEADVALARAELERGENLHAANFISASALDTRRTAVDAAEAALRQARAEADVAGNQSEYAVLRAEQSGIVVAADVEAGQVVSAGQTVIQVVQPSQREVLIYVPESRIRGFAAGRPAQVQVWGERRLYPATVREVAPVADRASRSYALRVAIDGEVDDLPLGATANVIFERPQEARLELPLAAVTAIESEPTAWIVDESDSVQPRRIQIGPMRESGVVVLEGLEEGMRVVVAGVHKLVPGERVRVIEASSPVALDLAR